MLLLRVRALICVHVNGQKYTAKLEGTLNSHLRLGKMAWKQLGNIALGICPNPVSSLSRVAFPCIGM